jgi:ubiquinone biosynthesis monooxygenase Coq7
MGDYYIREAVKPEDVDFREGSVDPSQLAKIRAGLRKLHTFEIMAVNIYKYQIASKQDDFNRLVIQAMANEMCLFPCINQKFFYIVNTKVEATRMTVIRK